MPLKHSKPLFSGLQKQNKQTNKLINKKFIHSWDVIIYILLYKLLDEQEQSV